MSNFLVTISLFITESVSAIRERLVHHDYTYSKEKMTTHSKKSTNLEHF